MVRLSPMGDAGLQAFLTKAVLAFAEDKVNAGNWSPEEAHEKSRDSFEKLLPAGVNSPGQYLFDIVDTEQALTVGMLWFGVIEDTAHPFAFIYELQVLDEYQRRGYGKQAMLALEGEVRKLGLNTISLHVFGHNRAAQALYDQLGYEVTNINMSKHV